MLANERVAGVKCSSEPCHDILRFKQAGGEDFIVFNGPDEQYLAGRLMGADAGIGGTYGSMPELYLKLEDLIRRGEIAKAQQLQIKITQFIYRLCSLDVYKRQAQYHNQFPSSLSISSAKVRVITCGLVIIDPTTTL